jgi:phosphoribosylaminoimidazolecarboxamide formyltransferase/IMP cyclohydrolase
MERIMQGRVRRALVSVYDKEGIVDFCRVLQELDIEILSSGGTARLLGENGILVTKVAEYTGSPEMLGGRVKTLHPRIHAGILAVRSNADHMADLKRAEIGTIDLVVVNLYPFENTAAIDGIGLSEVVEMIDVGGPSMVRAAAKNFAHVGVLVQHEDYAGVIEELRASGGLSAKTRHRLSALAFQHTATYDHAVYSYLSRIDADGQRLDDASEFPEKLEIELVKTQELRYGENPHQRAAFYREPLAAASFAGRASQLQGKPLSFNNILDFDAALYLAVAFSASACVIVKHGNPCGVALGAEPLQAFTRALACDPTSAFGGVIAFNRAVDSRAAAKIAEQFYEGVIAPEFDTEARQLLAKKKKLRILEVGKFDELRRDGFDVRRVGGGFLVQDWDRLEQNVRELQSVTRREPTAEEWRALTFAWTVVKHVKSNAIVYALDDRTIGIGAGQMSRVDSVRIGIEKAETPLTGAVLASDAFFPFRDGLDTAAKAGISAVIQPGGSIRDKQVIAAADEHDMAMVLTGHRHFRH